MRKDQIAYFLQCDDEELKRDKFRAYRRYHMECKKEYARKIYRKSYRAIFPWKWTTVPVEECPEFIHQLVKVPLTQKDEDIWVGRFVQCPCHYPCGLCGDPRHFRKPTVKVQLLNQIPIDPQFYFEEELDIAHEYSSHNKLEIEGSRLVGCFHCCKIYPAEEVVEYVGKGKDKALCPHCHIDAVLAGSKFNLSRNFLKEMQTRWFFTVDLYVKGRYRKTIQELPGIK